jgi:sulfopyruvate decarboxylase TPP-binding subunit
MVKVKEFWEYLCGELDYRFFSGVVCNGFKPLYDKMSSEFMHYIPAVNEKVALGIINGARLAGVKGAVLMDGKYLNDIITTLDSFNLEYKVPALIICYGELRKPSKNYIVGKSNLGNLIKKLEKESKPGIFFIGEGDLK